MIDVSQQEVNENNLEWLKLLETVAKNFTGEATQDIIPLTGDVRDIAFAEHSLDRTIPQCGILT